MRSAAVVLARQLARTCDSAAASSTGASAGAAWRRPCAASASAPPLAARCRALSTSNPSTAADDDNTASPPPPKASWLPAWARARLPMALGGDPGMAAASDLTLDAWATQIKRARQLAAAGQAIGGAARASADPQAQGNLRLYEAVVAAMDPAHRADPATFDGPARAATAAAAGVSVAQVDDCLAKYEWTRTVMKMMAERQAQGQAMPGSAEELERMLGEWRAAKGGGGGGKGGACPFAGRQAPGRNAVCARTGKKWKNCCGGGGVK